MITISQLVNTVSEVSKPTFKKLLDAQNALGYGPVVDVGLNSFETVETVKNVDTIIKILGKSMYRNKKELIINNSSIYNMYYPEYIIRCTVSGIEKEG